MLPISEGAGIVQPLPIMQIRAHCMQTYTKSTRELVVYVHRIAERDGSVTGWFYTSFLDNRGSREGVILPDSRLVTDTDACALVAREAGFLPTIENN